MAVFAKNLREGTRKMQGVSPTLPKENHIWKKKSASMHYHSDFSIFCFFVDALIIVR